MTMNEPRPGHDHPARPPARRPLPRQANPTWLGHVQPENYRRAPANSGGQFQPALPPAVPAEAAPAGRSRPAFLAS